MTSIRASNSAVFASRFALSARFASPNPGLLLAHLGNRCHIRAQGYRKGGYRRGFGCAGGQADEAGGSTLNVGLLLVVFADFVT